MKAPPDIQISSILYYLGWALRADPEIQKWTGALPSGIVAQTVEYQPMTAVGGQVHIHVSQLPALCLHRVSEHERLVPGTKPLRGTEFTGWLWYLFQPFQAESRDMHGWTKGARLTTLIWHRLQYYLRKQKMWVAAAGADGPSYDLQEVAKIKLLTMDGDSDRLEFDKVEGIKIPIKCWHWNAPYEEIDPPILNAISLGITSEEGSGVGVSADVDVSAP